MGGHRIVGVGAQYALVQRTGIVQLAGGECLLRLIDQIDRLYLRGTSAVDSLVETVDIAAAAEQLAGNRGLLRGLGQVTGLQCGIGLRQFGLADLAQAIAGAVVVRFQRYRPLEQFACAGPVIAIQMAILQCLLCLNQHAVEVGTRQHAAQPVLAEPECPEQHDEQQQQRQQPSAPAMLATRWRGCPIPRMARFDRHIRQSVAGGRTHIAQIELTQGGLGADGWMCVLLVSASAHDPWL